MAEHAALSVLAAALIGGAAAGLGPPARVAAQTPDLAGRVAAVRDGVARMSFATDPDVCGDGAGAIGRRDGNAGGTGFHYLRERGTMHGEWDDCVHGPARVALTVRGGRVAAVALHVAGTWPEAGPGVTDLGRVSAPAAAAYLLRVAASVPGERDAGDAMAAAVFADSAVVWQPLEALAENRGLSDTRRGHAAFWLSQTDAPEAARALGRVIDRAIASPGSAGLARTAIFALSQVHEPGVPGMMRHYAEDRAAPERVRKSAIFWLGQSAAAAPAELDSVYRHLADPTLRAQVIFALSQRHEPAALDALIRIARHDPDPGLRRKAIFWLGQSRDPRAADTLRAMILGGRP